MWLSCDDHLNCSFVRFWEFARGKSLSWALSPLQVVHTFQRWLVADVQSVQWLHQGTGKKKGWWVCFYSSRKLFIIIQKSGAAIVSDSERERTMVHDLLELKSKVDQIIAEAFQNNEKFVDVIREAFESVINRRQNKPAELIGTEKNANSACLDVAESAPLRLPIQHFLWALLLCEHCCCSLSSAKYVDTQLKSGNKEWSDEQLDRQLDRVMVLFRYIHGRYRSYLAQPYSLMTWYIPNEE